MKKILFILRTLPYPIDRDGLSVINYRLLKMAPKDCEFDIISLSKETSETLEGTQSISKQIVKIMLFPDKSLNSSFRRTIRLFRRFCGLGRISYDRFIRMQGGNYDLIYVCTPPSALYLSMRICSVPMFVNAVDSFSMLNFRFYKHHKTFIGFVKFLLYRNIERRCFTHSSMVNFVSSVDADY